jgi:uncharacterized membrane protein
MSNQDRKNAAIEAQVVQQELLMKSRALLPAQVIKNVEVIANHQDHHQQNTTVQQRGLDKITAFFGQPQFLYAQLMFFTTWEVYSQLVGQGVLPKSFLLFDLPGRWLEVAGLLISTGVLVYQTRQEELSKERSHLILQFNLLTEQKIAKLISLVEELRTDLPNVKNRQDTEADVMQQAADPQAILDVLQKNL